MVPVNKKKQLSTAITYVYRKTKTYSYKANKSNALATDLSKMVP